MGTWWAAVFFFGWLGGLIGYLALRDTDPPRAAHVAKWGLIWSGIWTGAVLLFYALVFLWIWNAAPV